MKRIDPHELARALAGPWADLSRHEARLASCRELPPELRALAESDAASRMMNISLMSQEDS